MVDVPAGVGVALPIANSSRLGKPGTMPYDFSRKPVGLRSFASKVMRVPDDLRRCVVFIGRVDGPSGEGFKAVGTALLVRYERFGYLVTVQHIAAGFGDGPFAVRLNKPDGTSGNWIIDPILDNMKWYCDESDMDVDLAVMPFDHDLRLKGYDCLFFNSLYFVDEVNLKEWDIGVGDTCYAVGLFRLMAGATRNLPVVHTGNISLIPGNERIPVKDWHNNSPDAPARYIDGYLVEIQNLQGLSGSPVLVRPAVDLGKVQMSEDEIVDLNAMIPVRSLFLLGVWQASWDAPPDEVQAAEFGRPVRVPVGLGTVIPVAKFRKILEMPAMRALRRERDAHSEREMMASLDADFGAKPVVSAVRDEDWLPEEEVAHRRDETLRRMAAMPPRHQRDMKLGKPRGRRSDS